MRTEPGVLVSLNGPGMLVQAAGPGRFLGMPWDKLFSSLIRVNSEHYGFLGDVY